MKVTLTVEQINKNIKTLRDHLLKNPKLPKDARSKLECIVTQLENALNRN